MNVVSFYQFLDLQDPQRFRGRLQAECERLQLLGTVLVAAEGFNGSLAGTGRALGQLLDWIVAELDLACPIETRWTEAAEAPFRRLRVRTRQEIVTLGRPDLLPHRRSGTYVPPGEWNALLDNPELLLVDTRNHYEIEVGTFPGAVDPGTDSFREFPEFARQLAEDSTDRPVAMFCTGGIRCEKATALMLELGFDEVYHLQGGVLQYLRDTPANENRWQGECFVFDTRVAVDRDLAEGGYVQCHACRRPLSSDDLGSADYREGVSCPYCIRELDADRARRLEERRKQVELARKRGRSHAGAK